MISKKNNYYYHWEVVDYRDYNTKLLIDDIILFLKTENFSLTFVLIFISVPALVILPLLSVIFRISKLYFLNKLISKILLYLTFKKDIIIENKESLNKPILIPKFIKKITIGEGEEEAFKVLYRYKTLSSNKLKSNSFDDLIVFRLIGRSKRSINFWICLVRSIKFINENRIYINKKKKKYISLFFYSIDVFIDFYYKKSENSPYGAKIIIKNGKIILNSLLKNIIKNIDIGNVKKNARRN